MKDLTQGILNYQNMSNTGALMISGEWGCGKTYHLKHVVFPKLKEQGIRPLYISLFGIKDTSEIPMRLLEAGLEYLATDGDDEEEKQSFLSGLLARGGKTLASIKWLTDKVDIEKILSANSDIFYNLIPVKKSILFLDDLERVLRTRTIDVDNLLGAINNLVEQRGYKVVVIANNTYIEETAKDKLTFKEKVIEKTLVYEPDVVEIYKEICNKEYDEGFRKHMLKDEYVTIIDPHCNAYLNDKRLIQDMRNIRILKFALSHYNKVYEKLFGIEDADNGDLKGGFMLSLWALTYGLAMKYKKNLLTYGDREQYVTHTEIPEMDFQLASDENNEGLFDSESDDETEETKMEEQGKKLATKHVTHLYNVFVKAHGLPILIVPPLFDFITAGIDLDKGEIVMVWENYKAISERNRVKPSYALLSKFMQSQWGMTNEEMRLSLAQLAQYVENGEFNDNMAYVNSATFLQHMLSLTDFSQKEIEAKIKVGIDIFYSHIKDLNILDKLNIDVISDQIPQISRWVVEYEKTKMEAVTTKSLNDDIVEVIRLFNEDLATLEKRLVVQYNSTKTPDFFDYPILGHIPVQDIINKVNVIQPSEVMAIYDILQSRFYQMDHPKATLGDIAFVQNLKAALEQRTPARKEYSDILIEDHLMKIVNKLLSVK